MKINQLDHVNLVTANLDTMANWYENVLGLKKGKRPNFPFAGAWLYAGDVALVHLVETTDQTRVGSDADLKLEHFAFSASGREKFEQLLKDLGQDYERTEVSDVNVVQFHIADPDGNHIHVDFDMSGQK